MKPHLKKVFSLDFFEENFAKKKFFVFANLYSNFILHLHSQKRPMKSQKEI